MSFRLLSRIVSGSISTFAGLFVTTIVIESETPSRLTLSIVVPTPTACNAVPTVGSGMLMMVLLLDQASRLLGVCVPRESSAVALLSVFRSSAASVSVRTPPIRMLFAL